MFTKLFHCATYILLALCFTAPLGLSEKEIQSLSPDLLAHEWGTFTSIAGTNGQAIDWLPLAGPADLPDFVEHFRNASFKIGLRGTVRMETPVLYFYTPRQTDVSVRVAFSKGLITEWYPRASSIGPTGTLNDRTLYEQSTAGSIAWDSVRIMPNLAAEFPHDNRNSHYYAARGTSSAPLRVMTLGRNQEEKFLFYRGVSVVPLPISATLTREGKLLARNVLHEEIPSVFLFERRGKKLGYRIGGALQGEVILDAPDLTATIDSISSYLQEILVAQGLYPEEAHAMLETWHDSWFEEGSRLFYILPARFLDGILPLSINPIPAQTVRVFVGRLEILSPATEGAVENAVLTRDNVMLNNYRRFLEPILQSILAKESNPARLRRLQSCLNSYYHSEIQENVNSWNRSRPSPAASASGS